MSDDGYSRSYRGHDPYGRGGSPTGASGHGQDDPLSELARLIGQGDAVEPQPDWRGAAPPVNYDGYQYPGGPQVDPRYANAPAGYPDPYQVPDPYQTAAGPVGHDPRYDAQPQFNGPSPGYGDPHFQGGGYDQAMYGQAAPQQHSYQGGSYFGNDGHGAHDDDYEDPPSRGRGGFFTVAAVLCLAIVGTAGAFAYRTLFSGSGSSAPPVILADAAPNKIVPATQSSDSARLGSDRPDLGQGERIVSREERPLNVQNAANGSPRVVFPDSQSAPPLPGNVSALAPVSPGAQPGPGEPRKVRTVAIKPEQQTADPFAQASSAPRVASNAAAFPTGTTQAVSRTVGARPAASAQSAPAAESQGDAPLSLSPQSAPAPEASPPRLKLASAASRPAPATSTVPAAAMAGTFVVQLAAQKSEEDANATFRAMQAKYASQLSGRQPIIRRKDLGEKGIFYGVQVGPFASHDDAVQLCESLKSAGGACMIQKN